MNNSIEHVHTINPCKFANQFMTELIQDLQLMTTLCCPKCIITYVDNDQEGCCYYSETDGKLELNCVFDYNIHGLFLLCKDTTEDEVNQLWIEAVLKECKHFDEMNDLSEEQSLFEKWTEMFKQV